mmetsp:Transcript_82143/g.227836  ORF Transcript_82143/g.227836 Transcript_82143/m.227836 type:complete len:355 (+) Transcript_82143:36-1100(+)
MSPLAASAPAAAGSSAWPLQEPQLISPSDPIGGYSNSGRAARAGLWAPLQQLCCSGQQGEAGEADDVCDLPQSFPFHQQFREESVSTSSLGSLITTGLVSPPGLVRDLVERSEVLLEDGARYRGQWSGRHRHGHGVLSTTDGQSYEGSFERSRAHGHGMWRTQDGTSYEGQWERDLKHGFGKYVHSDGTAYEGEWQLGEKCGRGTEQWPDGACYTGEFSANRKHGMGIYHGLDSKGREYKYEGQWISDRIEGEGSYRFSDGKRYTGQWEAGRMTGSGRMDFPDGSRYIGSFENGVKHGEGSFTTSEGLVCRAQWTQGKMGSSATQVAKAARPLRAGTLTELSRRLLPGSAKGGA